MTPLATLLHALRGENRESRHDRLRSPGAWPVTGRPHGATRQTLSPAASDRTARPPGEAATIAPPEVACVLRNVGTSRPGDTAATDALEVKGHRGAGAGPRRYIPSLYGLALGRRICTTARQDAQTSSQAGVQLHTDRGQRDFSVTLDANDVADLITSSSRSTPTSEIAAAGSFDGCRRGPCGASDVRRARLTPARAAARASPEQPHPGAAAPRSRGRS